MGASAPFLFVFYPKGFITLADAQSQPMVILQNFIDGNHSAAASGQTLPSYEPATGKEYARIPDSNKDDIETAVSAAKKAFPAWSKLPAKKRSEILLRLAHLIEENLDNLAEAEAKDNGKPVWLAKEVDIPRAAANFHFFATAILHYASEAHPMEDTAINYTLRNPIGVVGCISPWNLPLYLFTWKIAPALAAGNCVVAKPSEVTPMTAYLLSKLCHEAGVPDGVLNIVHGLGQKVGDAITRHPEIKAISFTGGTQTGETIAKIAAPMFKKLSLELGGKNPVLVFDDCDLEKAVATTVNSSFRNQGQICLCGSRIFIHDSIYEKFKKKFVEKVSQLKVSHPYDKDAQLGALVSKPHFEKVLQYVKLAKEEGGTVLTGGEKITLSGDYEQGWYMQPTVIEGLAFNCRTNQEEIFGPVVTLTPFTNEEHALMMANSTGYGLASVVWTENLTRAHRVAQQLEAGIVWINCWMLRDLRTPFGGIKNSGVGREGGFEALRFFTEPKNVCVKL